MIMFSLNLSPSHLHVSTLSSRFVDALSYTFHILSRRAWCPLPTVADAQSLCFCILSWCFDACLSCNFCEVAAQNLLLYVQEMNLDLVSSRSWTLVSSGNVRCVTLRSGPASTSQGTFSACRQRAYFVGLDKMWSATERNVYEQCVTQIPYSLIEVIICGHYWPIHSACEGEKTCTKKKLTQCVCVCVYMCSSLRVCVKVNVEAKMK